jgi:hypothetical protein
MVQLLKPVRRTGRNTKSRPCPARPRCPGIRRGRLAYALVALLVGITGGLGNALVSANLPAIQGQLGLTPAEAAWLPAAYVMVNVTANLLVFKFRQQYGMRLFTEIGLGLYAPWRCCTCSWAALRPRCWCAPPAALPAPPASTLSMLYMLQALPRAYTGKMVVIGVGIPQMATPLAWLLSPGLLDSASGTTCTCSRPGWRCVRSRPWSC